MSNYIVVWPKVRVAVGEGDKIKMQILDKGDEVPDGVSNADIANLALFGAIAGVSPMPSTVDPDVDAGDAPPPATIAEILAGVGNDKGAAAAALQAEHGRGGKPRKGLVEGLQAVIDAE